MSPLLHNIFYKFQHMHVFKFLFYWLTALKTTLLHIKNELFPPLVLSIIAFQAIDWVRLPAKAWLHNLCTNDQKK